MPDFLPLVESLITSAIVAGVTLRVVIGRRRTCAPWLGNLAWVLAWAAGMYAGCGILGQWPHWPAREDRDRLLGILLPLTLLVEAAAGWLPARWASTLRMVVAAATPPILLYRSSYLADLSGSNSAEWSTAAAVCILAALAAMLVTVWAVLAKLASRASGGLVWPGMVLVVFAAGVSVMLSGYFRGGQLGLPLAGAIAGVSLAPRRDASPPGLNPGLGISLVSTFSVLLIGRFFGALPSSMAMGLLFVPCLVWLAELPRIRRLGPRMQTTARLACVMIPLIGIVAWAEVRFTRAFSAQSKPSNRP